MLVRRPKGWVRDLQLLSSGYLNFSKTPAGVYYAMRYSRLQNPDWDFLSRCELHQPIWDVEAGYLAEELDRRGDYRYLRKRLDVGRRLGVRLNPDRLWFDAISIGYRAHDNLPDHMRAKMLGPILPHLAKAAEMSRIFLALKRRHSAALLALDHVNLPIWVLDKGGQIILSNQRAIELAEKEDGVSVNRKGYLECWDSVQTKELATAINEVCSTSEGSGKVSERLLKLKRKSGRLDLLADVAPIKDAGNELSEPDAGALLTIIDPDSLPSVGFTRFARVYELTRAETEVCELAFSGLTLDEIAEQRETSPATAKNQMAQILGKTETHRRSDLVRLILKTHPPTK